MVKLLLHIYLKEKRKEKETCFDWIDREESVTTILTAVIVAV